MEMQGLDTKDSFYGAGDGTMSNFYRELQELKTSHKRTQRILFGLLVISGLVLLALIIVVAVEGQRIHNLNLRAGLIPHPNVTFASESGDQSVNGLTYGGSLFRGTGFWSSRAVVPGPLTDHAGIAFNELVYIIGGADVHGNVTDRVWVYDSIFHNWTAKTPMPAPRYRFGCDLDTDNNKIYVAGGRQNDTGDAVTGPLGCVLPTYIYDIASDSWTIGADIPNRGSDQCAGYVNEKFYVMGGWAPDYSGVQNFNQIYDPVTNEWTAGPALPTARGDLMCTIFQGEVYAIGGYVINATNSSDQNSFSATVESFNPNTTVWTTRPPMLTPRGDGAVTVLPGDKMMVVGGEGHYDNNMNWKYPKHVNEIYYGQDYTWVEKAMIPTARFRTAAATAGGLAFVFGGADVCIVDGLPNDPCPALNASEVYLDVDHPHVYIYLKNEAYNDNAALTTYPV